MKRATMLRNIGTLADIFTDPRSVELIREALARVAPSTMPGVAGRSAAGGAFVQRKAISKGLL